MTNSTTNSMERSLGTSTRTHVHLVVTKAGQRLDSTGLQSSTGTLPSPGAEGDELPTPSARVVEEGVPPESAADVTKADAQASKKKASAKGASGRDYTHGYKPDPKGSKVDMYPAAKAAFQEAEVAFKEKQFATAKCKWDEVAALVAAIDPLFDAAEAARDAVSTKQKDPTLQYNFQHKPGGAKKAVPKYPEAVDKFDQGIAKLVQADFAGAKADWEKAASVIASVNSAMKAAETVRDKISTGQKDKTLKYDFMHKPSDSKQKVHKYPDAVNEFDLGTKEATEQNWQQALLHWQRADAVILGESMPELLPESVPEPATELGPELEPAPEPNA